MVIRADCTHAKILSLCGINTKGFRKRKEYFSINVHDATIFNYSNITVRFENNKFYLCHLLKDSDYLCCNYLLTILLNDCLKFEKENCFL